MRTEFVQLTKKLFNKHGTNKVNDEIEGND